VVFLAGDHKEAGQLALLLCKKLALDLDENDYSSLSAISKLLIEMPVEETKSAVSQQIGLDRVVYHELDEKGSFQKVLLYINSTDKKPNVSSKNKNST
jgi:hypothetical protein